jgi:hypothetical protein
MEISGIFIFNPLFIPEPMHPFPAILMLIFFIPGTGLPQTKEYKLTDKTIHADIDHHLYTILSASYRPASLTTRPFKPIRGKFIVYRFIATYQGESFTHQQKEFHDILIVKTDKRNKIIMAFQYTLEWTDSPEADLYRSTCKDVYLLDNMRIEKFAFKRSADYDKENTSLGEHALLRF